MEEFKSLSREELERMLLESKKCLEKEEEEKKLLEKKLEEKEEQVRILEKKGEQVEVLEERCRLLATIEDGTSLLLSKPTKFYKVRKNTRRLFGKGETIIRRQLFSVILFYFYTFFHNIIIFFFKFGNERHGECRKR